MAVAEPLIYLDGRFVRKDEARLSPFNRGFSFGDGVFETLRVYSGRVFRLDAHLKRLYEGLRVLDIRFFSKAETVLTAVSGLIEKNDLTDASLKITAFRTGETGLVPDPNAAACFMVTSGLFDLERKNRFAKGIAAAIVSIRRNPDSPHVYIKSLNYLDNLLGRMEAGKSGCDEAIFLNHSGFVTEGSISNIFMVKNKSLLTPPLKSGILNGITREVVFEIAADLGFSCRAEYFKPDRLMAADEAFMTNSLMEIMPLVRVGGQSIGPGKSGSITNALMKAYQEKVDKELLI